MKSKKKLSVYFIFLFFLLMILFPKSCTNGANTGLNLWFSALIPSILPFIIISNIMIKLNTTKLLSKLFHPFIGRIFHTSIYGTYAIVMGYVCGYPVGAKIVNDLLHTKKITDNEASYLYKFVNNASPAFIQSYIIIKLLQKPSLKLMALVLIYLPTLLTGFLFRPKNANAFPKDNTNNENNSTCKLSISVIDDSILEGFLIITKLGGYLILFSIFSNLIISFHIGNTLFKLVLLNITEITVGTYYVSLSDFDVYTKLFLCCISTVFGGFSTIMQTKSVCNHSNLKISLYLKYRLIALVFCFIIYIILRKLPIIYNTLSLIL